MKDNNVAATDHHITGGKDGDISVRDKQEVDDKTRLPTERVCRVKKSIAASYYGSRRMKNLREACRSAAEQHGVLNLAEECHNGDLDCQNCPLPYIPKQLSVGDALQHAKLWSDDVCVKPDPLLARDVAVTLAAELRQVRTMTKPQRFRHYKGGIYEYLFESVVESDRAQRDIVYRAPDGTICNRRKEIFFGEVEVDGKIVRRFAHLGE